MEEQEEEKKSEEDDAAEVVDQDEENENELSGLGGDLSMLDMDAEEANIE